MTAMAARPPSAPTRSWIERLWSSVADRGRLFAAVPAASVPPLERACQLAEALLSGRGEASGAAVSRELQAAMAVLGADDQAAFFRFLATRFAPAEAPLRAAAEAYLAAPDAATAARLTQAAEPPRQELLRRMNLAPGGTATLLALRRDLLLHLPAAAELAPLEADLRHLFASWFNRGFLELRRIDWQTPAAVLEKLIAYEAVHAIQGWDDLRRRLAADRRCFGFFHPALPDEPLIFVEVALVQGLAGAVGPLLAREPAPDRAPPAAPDTAIFYSISNSQDGLRGVSFGNLLIKQVVEELQHELPQLVRFATLSPAPTLRAWVEAEAPEAVPDRDDWWQDETTAEPFRPRLLQAAARFLTDRRDGRGPADPVARFHLRNGASLERINWLGNPTSRGLAESFGIMVNYLYDPDRIEANHEAFARDGTVACSADVAALPA